jgi:hypothetical protein
MNVTTERPVTSKAAIDGASPAGEVATIWDLAHALDQSPNGADAKGDEV